MNWSDYFYYDETSKSKLRWKVEIRSGVNLNKVEFSPGDEAGFVGTMGAGYYMVGLNYKHYAVHKIVWELHYEPVPDDKVLDHENGDSLDNTVSNLRLVTSRVNSRNRKMSCTNTSGVTGVSFRAPSNSWGAHVFDENGVRKAKCFAVRKYGVEESFALAVAWRKAMLEEVNSRGAGYSDRHGLNKE